MLPCFLLYFSSALGSPIAARGRRSRAVGRRCLSRRPRCFVRAAGGRESLFNWRSSPAVLTRLHRPGLPAHSRCISPPLRANVPRDLKKKARPAKLQLPGRHCGSTAPDRAWRHGSGEGSSGSAASLRRVSDEGPVGDARGGLHHQTCRHGDPDGRARPARR